MFFINSWHTTEQQSWDYLTLNNYLGKKLLNQTNVQAMNVFSVRAQSKKAVSGIVVELKSLKWKVETQEKVIYETFFATGLIKQNNKKRTLAS